MRLAALLQKGVNHDPTLLPAREALKMATLNGAKALGLDSIIGSLETGKRADLLIIDTNNTFMQPIYDYYSAIVYSMNSSCIESVLVDGKVVMEEKKMQIFKRK
jgi:5-methylthioadenosine/S-adenosylhomocysteine deaminase